MRIVSKIKTIMYCDKLYYLFLFFKKKGSKGIPFIVRLLSQKRMKGKIKESLSGHVIPLYIETPDKMGQSVHPDIIKDEKYGYIMSINPYPFGWDVFENPVFFRSSNLVDWKYLSGPIDYPTIGLKNHLSDSTIVKAEKFFCYYRECIYSSNPPLSVIYAQDSNDCIHWENKSKLFSEPMSKIDIISPDIDYNNNEFTIWACIKKDDRMEIGYTNNPKLDIDSFVILEINGIPESKILWHLSSIKYKDGTILLLTLADDFGGSNSRLHIGYHKNGENAVSIIKAVDIINDVPTVDLEYRATGIVEEECLKIIASVRYKDRTWGCVLIEEDGIENLVK